MNLTLEDNRYSADPTSTIVTFDEDSPRVPAWGWNALLLSRVAGSEPVVGESLHYTDVVKCDTVKNRIGEMEEMIRRDPLSPWFRFARAKFLAVCNDAQAHAAFADIFLVAHPDFHDFLLLAGELDGAGEPELASKAFEVGYANFLEQGFDPRMVYALISRLVLYRAPSQLARDRANLPGWSAQQENEVERLYRLAPYVEGSRLAWEALAIHAPPDQAAIWKRRAADAQASAFMDRYPLMRLLDICLYVLAGGGLAVYLYIFLMYGFYWRRYRELEKQMGAKPWWRSLSWLALPYWSRSQRWGFLLLVLVVWIAGGLGTLLLEIESRVASAPVSMFSGTIADPASRAYLDKLPFTTARDLLQAVALQQNGDNAPAESLYRSLPQFPEAWNNLGVLLKNSGKDSEARQAFETALRLDPALHEAALNAGQPPADFWTEQYHKIFSRPMLAPPSAAHVLRAFAGPRRHMLLTVLKGPDPMMEEPILERPADSLTLQRILIYMPLALAVVLVMSRPKPLPETTASPFKLAECLLVGTSARWGWLGPLMLGVWTAMILILITRGTLVVEDIAIPNWTRAFGLPTAWFSGPPKLSAAWIYIPPAVLFLLNLVVVLTQGSKQANRS